MVATINPQQNRQKEFSICLEGVSWQTFIHLLTDMGEAPAYGLDYAQGSLEVRCLPTTLSPESQVERDSNRFILFNNIRWQTYQALMADVGDGRAWRVAYDGSTLEIRMPLPQHEEPKELLVDFVTVLVDELEIEIRKLGALTLEREDLSRAIEPDSCFYIRNELSVRGKERIDLPNDPPPDLVIESDHTNSSLKKHAIYAALGVPEIWRYHKKMLQVYHLINGSYERSQHSLAFPLLPVAEVSNWIESSKEIGQRAAVKQFRLRIQEILRQL